MRTGKRKEIRNFFKKTPRLKLLGIACLLVLLGGAVAFAATELGASKGVELAGIEYYAALDDEWQRIDMAKTVPGQEETGSKRYYTTPSALEEYYGKFGFSAKNYAGELLFPHTVPNDSTQIWADAKPVSDSADGYHIMLTGKDKIYVYYLPANTKENSSYFTNNKSLSDQKLLSENMFYSVAVSDPDKKIDNKPDVKYVATGGTYSVTLPADNDYQWEAVNRKTLEKLEKTTVTTKENNDKKTITLTFTNISEPIKIQPVTPENSQLKIVYNAATLKDNLQEMGDSSASIQQVESDGSINNQDSFTFYMDTTDENASVKVVSPDSDRALVKVNRSNQNKKFWYTFAGWRINGTGTILLPDAAMNLQELQRYEVDGVIRLDATWTGKNDQGRIDSANFYVNKNCEIADNMSNGANTVPVEGFTTSIYTAPVEDKHGSMTYGEDGSWLLLAPENDYSKAYEVDTKIREMAETAVGGVRLQTFPSDEEVLANLRANYNSQDPIKVDGKPISKDNLTTANFKVRWYTAKYQKSDGWHVDGILVSKAGKVVIKKTIAGSADAATARLKENNFNITVSHTDTTREENPVDYTLVLKSQTDADEGETGYTDYDENTHTYTWVLTVRDYQQYEIKENNYKIGSFDRSEHTYTVRNAREDVTPRDNAKASSWQTYDSETGITITADSYPDDAPESSYQTVELKNLYVSSSYITLDKLDSFTVDGMKDVKFTVSKPGDSEFKLYRYPGSYAYSDKQQSAGSDDNSPGFSELVKDKTVVTDRTGMLFLKLSKGTYRFKEEVPEGYQKRGAYFEVEIEQNTDGNGTHVASATLYDDKGKEVTNDSDFTISIPKDSMVTVNNKAEQLTTVTAQAKMSSDVKADSVRVELWCNGAKVEGSDYTQVLSKDNDWKFTWKDLPLYANGKVADYSLRETYIGDTAYDSAVDKDGYADYEVTYEPCKYREADAGEYNDQASWTDKDDVKHYAKHALLVVNNANKYVAPQYVNVNTKIVWDDSNNQDGTRPSNVNVKLLDNEGNPVGTEHSLNESSNWEGLFLQLNKLGSDNKDIKYQIIANKSFAVPDGYTAKITGDMTEGFTITLSHTPKTPATLTGNSALKGEKILTGRDMKVGEKFDFTLEAADDATTAALDSKSITIADGGSKATVTGAKKGEARKFYFGDMTFRKAGTYTFNMKETLPEDQDSGKSGVQKDGVTYDSHTAKVIVAVEDNGSGQLAAAVTTENTTFTNTYEAVDLALNEVCHIKATNVLYGHSAAAGQFQFKLKAKDADSAAKLNKNLDAGKTLTIDSPAAEDSAVAAILEDLPITLTHADVDKTYAYTLQETRGNTGGYTYDSSKYELQITAKDAADGTLAAEVKLLKDDKVIVEKTVSATATATGDDGIVMAFVNYYKASTEATGGTSATINATKTLQGRSLKANEFTFHLKTRPLDGSAGQTLQTKTNNADGSISFAELSYKTAEGAAGNNAVVLSGAISGENRYGDKSVKDGKDVYTLHYTVCEDTSTSALPAGVSADTDTINVDVVVTDNGDGTLTAQTQYPSGTSCDFVNVYSTGDPVSFRVNGNKSLNHAKELTPNSIAKKFTFTLSAETTGAPVPVKTTAQNDAEGNVDFGEITYQLSDLDGVTEAADGSRTKTFTYKVTESGAADGVTNDNISGKTFAVTLKDDGKGYFTVTSNVTEGPLFSFVNTYSVGELDSSITSQIDVTKKLTGRDLKAGEFQFELVEDGKVVETGTNDADGNVTFKSVKYTKPGSHLYTVREVQGDAAGVTYDTQEYMIQTQVTDQGDGSLKAEHQLLTWDNDELKPAEKQEIQFANKYKTKSTTVNLEAVKRLTGKDLKDGQFTFQLKDEKGKVVDEAKNGENGVIAFKELTFDKAGTYSYTVSEVNDKQKDIKYDDSEKTVKIKVTDNGSGALEASVETSEDLSFTNVYQAKDPSDNPSVDPGNNGNNGNNGSGDNNGNNNGNAGTDGTNVNSGSGAKTGDSTDIALALGLLLIAATTAGILLVRRRLER